MRLDERLRGHITNDLAPVTAPLITGIVGDEPSKYAKTPSLWNAVYKALQWDAISLPWDVRSEALAGFVRAIRNAPEVAGFSVTVPHKVAIVPFLDTLDPIAREIGAVNTVGRTADGGLVGYNTDGQGAVDALTRTLPGLSRPFMEHGLSGRNVLLLGAGGAARAVAFYTASQIGQPGTLRIANRTSSRAVELADAVRRSYGTGEGGGEDQILSWIGEADLVINATVLGQSGWRRAQCGSFLVEPYSPLAPAAPAYLNADRSTNADGAREWFAASHGDLKTNATLSIDALMRLPPAAVCFDLVYAPLETRFLREARFAGHATLNGKWMNVAQAADGFATKVLARQLAEAGISGDAAYDRVFQEMARVW